MKPAVLAIAALLVTGSALAERTVLSGHFDRTAAKKISLQYYEDPADIVDRKKIFHETETDANKDFKLSFNLEHPVMINVMNGDKWLFYNIIICPGDSIHMIFTDSSVSLEGRGEKHMAFMFDHMEKFLAEPEVNKEFNSSYVRLDALPYAQYWKKRLDDQLAYMEEYFKDTVISPAFRHAFEYEVQYDYAIQLLQYAWRRSKDHRFLFRNKEYTAFLDAVKINNPDALISSRYVYFLRELPYSMYTSNINRNDDNDPENDYYNRNQYRLRDSIARQYFTGKVYDIALYHILDDRINVLKHAKGLKHFDKEWEAAQQEVKELGRGFHNDSLFDRLQVKLDDIRNADKPAPDFSAMDKDGNPVKLSGLKGKVVYAEFWSTTCAPCVQELPATKQLQERYKDRDDLVFLYISFDSPKSRAEEFIARKGFTGIHWFAPEGFTSDAARKYNVAGIPRYILIDKNGRLITGDARRPSHNAAEQINAALEKG